MLLNKCIFFSHWHKLITPICLCYTEPMLILLGACLGFTSVALGAYADHGLVLALHEQTMMATALRYNQLYAIVSTSIGLYATLAPPSSIRTHLTYTGYLFVLSTGLFSVSIYTAVIANAPQWTALTPVGGILIMLAWISVVIVGIRIARAH